MQFELQAGKPFPAQKENLFEQSTDYENRGGAHFLARPLRKGS
jgi:hypothetical protein